MGSHGSHGILLCFPFKFLISSTKWLRALVAMLLTSVALGSWPRSGEWKTLYTMIAVSYRILQLTSYFSYYPQRISDFLTFCLSSLHLMHLRISLCLRPFSLAILFLFFYLKKHASTKINANGTLNSKCSKISSAWWST